VALINSLTVQQNKWRTGLGWWAEDFWCTDGLPTCVGSLKSFK